MGWLTTYTGAKFDPEVLDKDSIRIEDIAHGLARTPRFGGQCNKFYSVAQHSMYVADLLREKHPHLVYTGLMHDAAEAYLSDIPSPLKQGMDGYQRIEDRVTAAIFVKFGVFDYRNTEYDYLALKNSDLAACWMEAQYLFDFGYTDDWDFQLSEELDLKPPLEDFDKKTFEEVESQFIERFEELKDG